MARQPQKPPISLRLGPLQEQFEERLAAEGGKPHALLRRLIERGLSTEPKGAERVIRFVMSAEAYEWWSARAKEKQMTVSERIKLASESAPTKERDR